MTRTIQDIKKSMTEQFMTDEVIRAKYGFSEGDSFEDKFSKVSLENIIFFIVASAIYALEALFGQFKDDVETKIAGSVIASIPWYHKMCLNFQYGDALVYDPRTMQYKYEIEDESKKVIKYASIREDNDGVEVLVSTEEDGKPSKVSDDVLMLFKQYLNAVKPAGVLVKVNSKMPDKLRINLKVQYDPLVLHSDGSLIANKDKFPVNQAISEYVAGIVYGGIFNKTKLVDAVQKAEGVVDVVISAVTMCPHDSDNYVGILGNNAQAASGSFVVEDVNKEIQYVPEL